MVYNPSEQFVVTLHHAEHKTYHLGSTTFSSTTYINETLVICTWIIIFYLGVYVVMSQRKATFMSSAILGMFKFMYTFVYGIVCTYPYDNGRMYFPFFFYLFLFIITSNLIGILPYAFTMTSHLSITFTLAFMVWFAILIIGFVENGIRFFSLFFPRGVPFVLVPFLVLIETVSYIFRSVSLALRLFANIVAGHISPDTLALFIHKMIYPAVITGTSVIIAILPFMVCMMLIIFEFVVALLQGYIFVVLSCIYTKDSYSAQQHQ